MLNYVNKFRLEKNTSRIDDTSRRSRPRLTCHHCHKSKLRCDRNQPCSNCSKRGKHQTCSYEHRSESSRTQALEDRLGHLESILAGLQRSSYNSTVALPPQYNTSTDVTIPIATNESSPTTNEMHQMGHAGPTHW
jgi:hypothetical protein